jgi:hypothetical protein
MSVREPAADPARRRSPRVQAGVLWAGGVATAVVAALVAAIGELIFDGILDVPLVAITSGDRTTSTDRASYWLGAAALALLATGLMHLLLVAVPQPIRFFRWVLVLTAAVLVAAPFAYDEPSRSQVATAVTGLGVVIAIGALLPGVARRAVRPTADRRAG